MSRNQTYNRLVRVVIATTEAGIPGYERLDLITAICREFAWDREQFAQRVEADETKAQTTTMEGVAR